MRYSENILYEIKQKENLIGNKSKKFEIYDITCDYKVTKIQFIFLIQYNNFELIYLINFGLKYDYATVL